MASIEVGLSDAYDEACRMLGDQHVRAALMAKSFAEREAELLAERDDLLHRADHAPDPTNPT